MAEQIALHDELVDWCRSYVTAFEAFDLEAIGRHWAFPALIVSGERQFMMPDAAAFNRNTGALIDFYERQDARKVQRTVIEVQPLLGASAAMKVRDIISTPTGDRITEWVSAYVLRRTQEGWRAVFADATGEAEAWAARGTPLGK